MQHPILTPVDGGGEDRRTVDEVRAAALAPACDALEAAITRLAPSDPCGDELRAASRALRRLAARPPLELREAPQRQRSTG